MCPPCLQAVHHYTHSPLQQGHTLETFFLTLRACRPLWPSCMRRMVLQASNLSSFSIYRLCSLPVVGVMEVLLKPHPHHVGASPLSYLCVCSLHFLLVSWSPKGKQLALGLQSGSIVTFSPTDTSKTKSYIPKPDSPTSQALISTTWLSNPDFFAIYIPQGPLAPDVEQSHLILSLDAKANTSTEVKLTSPYLPFPGMRPPGSFTAIFRNWDPAKFLIFVGDSTSSDIGLLGCTADPSGPHSESWTNFSLEETSTPTVPLDRDMNDTVLLGLSLDLTGTQTYNHKTASGEDSELPPPPVMYAYASDGTLVGWHILNLKGTPYPGMISASAPALATQQSSSIEMQASTEAVIKSPALSSGQPTTQPSSVFGQSSSLTAPSAFGQPPAPSAFGQNSFGQPSGFGAFSQSGTGGAFGQPSSL